MEDEDNAVRLSTDNAPATESKTREEGIVHVQVESLPREERIFNVVQVESSSREERIINVQVEPNLDPRSFARRRSAKLRMPRDEQIDYMVPVYLRRLRAARKINLDFLENGQGTSSEIQRRIDKLDELIGLVKSGTHEAAAEFAIKNGITSSLLQGGGGYPSLTGAHFDYITTLFPNRTREMRDRIGARAVTGWSKKDRAPKLAS